jgi:hypothetical protein
MSPPTCGCRNANDWTASAGEIQLALPVLSQGDRKTGGVSV